MNHLIKNGCLNLYLISPILSLFLSLIFVQECFSASNQDEKVVVFIGDSLTQGYGVKAPEAYPELLSSLMSQRGIKVRVINGGISGSVTADADRRVQWYLKAKPDLIVLALGANDGLKGTPVKVIESHLMKAIDVAQARQIPIALIGMQMLTNLGTDYVTKFSAVYKNLAEKRKVPLMPFLLQGVALKKEYNQIDMRHPNALGHRIIAKNVADFIFPLLAPKTESQKELEKK